MITDAAMKVAAPEANTEHLITLSTGVVLRCKTPSPTILIMTMARFPRPDVPVVFNQQMGRNMENPEDPEYKSRVQAWEVEMSEAILNAMILFGTELHQKPNNLPGPMDDEWVKDLVLIGLPVEPMNERWRYLRWVMAVAMAKQEDTQKIREVVGRLAGVTEASVQAAEHFPGGDQKDK